MAKERKRQGRVLYIDGQAVPVTEEVYRAYWHYTDKEDYFSRLLKTEKMSVDQEKGTVTFIPSREDSLDRLLAMDKQFAAQSTPVEDEVVSSLWLEEILRVLTAEEQQIIHQLYFLERSEREVSAMLNLALATFQRRKRKLLERLRSLLEEKF